MKFEMTRCNQCGSDMLMGVTICPSCGKPQSGFGKPGGLYQPGAMLAVGLAAAVLLIFNWIKSPAPTPSQLTSAVCHRAFSMMAVDAICPKRQ